jgi:YesN/AraC family two-component response regulator
VIEVDPKIVESFLGRIEDPRTTHNDELNIINDPAFRSIMVVELVYVSLKELDSEHFRAFLQKYNQSISQTINGFHGRIVEQQMDHTLVSFKTASEAIACATTIQSQFESLIPENQFNIGIKIGISAGVPVTKENVLFEKAIKSAKRMCEISKADIVVSAEVKDLYFSENINAIVRPEQIYFLTASEETFLHTLMNFTESKWNDEHVSVDDFNTMGFSESQLYRKITELIGKSPSTFLKEYRLKKAVQLLKKNEANISEVSTLTGFNSPSYFSKCFKTKYCISPSDFVHSKKIYYV